jgi:hypothetical protein
LYYTSFVGVRSRYVFPPVWVFNMTSWKIIFATEFVY